MKPRVSVIGRVALIAAIALAGAFAARARVSAHASYDHSNPADKQVLASAPAQLTITFVSAIVPDPGTFAFVSNGDTDVSAGPSTVSPTDPDTLVLPLQPNLPSGKYDVFWKSTDADDGGVTFGHFSFFVGSPSPADVAAAAAGVSVAVPDDATDKALTNVNAGGSSSGSSNCGTDSMCNYCAEHPGTVMCPKSGG